MYQQYHNPIPKLFTIRFLTILTHLIIIILLFQDRKNNVVPSLGIGYTSSDYTTADTNLIIWLSLSAGFLAIELLSFIFTLTTFVPSQSFISIACHSAAIFILFPYYVDSWKYFQIQWVFGFCTVVPIITEIITYILKFSFPKTFV